LYGFAQDKLNEFQAASVGEHDRTRKRKKAKK
jgi:hypothetical protein